MVLTTPTPVRAPLTGWLGVVSVTIALFSIVTTEILPIGLLTSIGADFTVSDGMAGLMMTMPGLVAAVAAPLATSAAGRVDRRNMLCLFIFLLVLADALVAAAPAYWVVLVSRVLVGVTIGGFWSIAAGLAERLVSPGAVGRANAVIFSAVPLGSVLGVPAGTLLGEIAGWRTTFVVTGVLTGVVLGMLMAFLPPLPPHSVTRIAVLRRLLRVGNVRFALLTTFLVVLAHFSTYTYVTPFLEQVTRVGAGTITLLLLIYGGAGLFGNFLGGAAIARRPRGTLGCAAAMIACATLLLPVLGRWEAGALVVLVMWGIGYGAVPVSTQAWFAKSAPDAPEAASVLFTASFQATFALGALAGGVVVDHGSPGSVMLLGGLVATTVIATVATHAVRGRTWPDAEALPHG
ncbi:putative MFS family arabinose efflux permease [Nocardia tenerifensis]|uniref:Putative MFS family arabinose efflux permease n=1 Tax=Nocardia tenerifensis TaxID=228006 RepID=A0A318K6Q7_9NOCA|nr:MFS transporter [Nocardia tenerifensis]PXX64313.1 putative MFS family arabinose efflux permease [Nocardia tenerifensis]